MPVINVKGSKWDVESVEGNTVTLVGGQEIEVSDGTLKDAESALSTLKPTLERAVRKLRSSKK